jgi:6-phosphogluconolactonase (cycloisomerase 2 family)
MKNRAFGAAVKCGVAGLGVALCLQAWPAGASEHEQHASKRFVYVETNDTSNAVLGFQRDSQGNLTPVPGGPFPTGGKGFVDPAFAIGPPDSDQEVVVDHRHKLLFAVNSGSNTVAVFRINPHDGSLKPVPNSPFPSGGINPVSVGLRGKQIVIINKNGDPNQKVPGALPNIVTRHVTADGQIVEEASNTNFDLPLGSSPTQALTANDRPFVFDALLFAASIASYRLYPDGRLVANPPQPLPASENVGDVPALPLGLWANPNARQLYVGFASVNKVGVYTWGVDGVPIFQHSVPNSGQTICWLRSNSTGTRLYTTNSASLNISVYDTTDAANPKEIQVQPSAGLGQPFQLEVDSSDRFIYVASQRSEHNGSGNALHVFAVSPDDGTLSEVPSSPVPITVVDPDVRVQGVAFY